MTANAKQRLDHLAKRIVEIRAEHDAAKDMWEADDHKTMDEQSNAYDRYKSARDRLFANLFDFLETAKRELGIGEAR